MLINTLTIERNNFLNKARSFVSYDSSYTHLYKSNKLAWSYNILAIEVKIDNKWQSVNSKVGFKADIIKDKKLISDHMHFISNRYWKKENFVDINDISKLFKNVYNNSTDIGNFIQNPRNKFLNILPDISDQNWKFTRLMKIQTPFNSSALHNKADAPEYQAAYNTFHSNEWGQFKNALQSNTDYTFNIKPFGTSSNESNMYRVGKYLLSNGNEYIFKKHNLYKSLDFTFQKFSDLYSVEKGFNVSLPQTITNYNDESRLGIFITPRITNSLEQGSYRDNLLNPKENICNMFYAFKNTLDDKNKYKKISEIRIIVSTYSSDDNPEQLTINMNKASNRSRLDTFRMGETISIINAIMGVQPKVKIDKFNDAEFMSIPISGEASILNKASTKFNNWAIKNSKYIFNYWNQIGYYGYDTSLEGFTPSNYIAMSTIWNSVYVPNTKIIDIFDKTNSNIIKTIPWKNNLVVFTENSTSLVKGRIAEIKQLIHSDVGLPFKYKNTVQVVSDSIVMYSGKSVYAFVPRPGTDESTSLSIRNIGKPIESKFEEIIEEFKDYELTFSSVTANNNEYWLIIAAKSSNNKQNKTFIFKYIWNNFAWLLNEYPVHLQDFSKINTTTIIASDLFGNVYNLINKNPGKFYKDYINTFYTGQEDLFNQVNDDGSIRNQIIKSILANIKYETDTYKTNDVSNIPGINMDLIFDSDKKWLKPWDLSKLNSQTDMLGTLGFKLKPINYSLVLGARSPYENSDALFSDVSLKAGTHALYPSNAQMKYDIYTNNSYLTTTNQIIQSQTNVVSKDSALTKWDFNNSAFANPGGSVSNTKVRNRANNLNIKIYGQANDRLFIDSISIRSKPSNSRPTIRK